MGHVKEILAQGIPQGTCFAAKCQDCTIGNGTQLWLGELIVEIKGGLTPNTASTMKNHGIAFPVQGNGRDGVHLDLRSGPGIVIIVS